MNIDQRLESLKKIKRVDAPPYLLTRVMARIHSVDALPAPLSWRWAFMGAAIVVVVLNAALVFSSYEKKNQNEISDVASAMALSHSNELYND